VHGFEYEVLVELAWHVQVLGVLNGAL
jgi:hypothetical protein